MKTLPTGLPLGTVRILKSNPDDLQVLAEGITRSGSSFRIWIRPGAVERKEDQWAESYYATEDLSAWDIIKPESDVALLGDEAVVHGRSARGHPVRYRSRCSGRWVTDAPSWAWKSVSVADVQRVVSSGNATRRMYNHAVHCSHAKPNRP